MNRVLSLGFAAFLLAVPGLLEAQGREVVMTAGRGGAPSSGSATLSNVIKAGGLVFASGQLPARGDSTIETQTTSTLENVKRLFEAAGTNMNNAVQCTVFLVDVKDFQGMNSAYAKFWSPENPRWYLTSPPPWSSPSAHESSNSVISRSRSLPR